LKDQPGKEVFCRAEGQAQEGHNMNYLNAFEKHKNSFQKHREREPFAEPEVEPPETENASGYLWYKHYSCCKANKAM